ncbi:hypothetical protein GOODEAATRI_003438 [Goodea atripinnis]|uniref:T-box domain-containing protein n=1 Tax=Goodea atripinnis TaxID=208336 RepID=A0ABV0P153_9TELE
MEAPVRIPRFPSACDVAPRLLGPSPGTGDPSSKPQKDEVKMELENSSLWKQFSSVGTEMIITKKGRSGTSAQSRRLRLKLSGLNPSLRYILLLDIVPADNSRYRFQGGGWQAVGGAEARLPDRVFIHPDSPATGAHWQSRIISFHYAKLTNNTLDTQGHVTASSDLQALTLTSLPPLPDSSCGFRPDEASYPVPEHSLDLSLTFMTSQMSDINVTMANGMQEKQENEAALSMIEGTSHPQPSFRPVDYPSPMLPATPSLQQTSFNFPTPPPSDSSSPSSGTFHTVPGMVSPHTPAAFGATSNTCPSDLQDQTSPHSQGQQGEPDTDGSTGPMVQTSGAFTYPNVLPMNTDTEYKPLAASLHCSLPSNGAGTSFALPSIPQQMQTVSFPTLTPSATLSFPNLSHQTAAPFLPPSSFPHSSSSLPHHSFPPSSCLAVSSSFQQPLTSAALPQTQPHPSSSSYTCSYPSAGVSTIPQFTPAPPYRPEMVLHRQALLPQLDASLPSSTPPQALYPAFPSYPLRLHQDPHSSLPASFRHLYRQHQQSYPHSQGSYISARAVF